jgi:hypothetical protein
MKALPVAVYMTDAKERIIFHYEIFYTEAAAVFWGCRLCRQHRMDNAAGH